MARPEMRLGLQQRTEQQMLLLPRMLQSIEVLQLPSLELAGWLRRAFEENEALALEEPEPPPALPGRAGVEASQRYDEWLSNQPAPEKSLVEQVEEQLALADLAPAQLEWVRFLVRCLDEHGYLSTADDRLLELARESGLEGDETELGKAIATLQGLEPRGIGGRDAVEALLLQLRPDDEDYELLCALVEDFLGDVARNRLPAVSRALGIDLAQLERLLERLRQLDPSPARELSDRPSRPLRPDVLVQPAEGGFEVSVERCGLPAVHVDERVREVSRDPGQPAEVRRYLRERLDQARWIVEAVEQRRSTLRRIAARVFERQRDFLSRGPGHLVPLRMNQLADELELHVSTVSRAVAGKYAQTPWGLFPLRHFFQASAGSAEGAARSDVCERVRQVIAAEDPRRPLSDDDVAAALRSEGLDLARRTVAKYRTELGIPSSYRRRKFG